MCRPWSKQLNWWDSISLFLIPCRWLASKRVSALIHVRNIYRQWFSHRDHRPWLLFQLSGKVTVHVVCVCVCVWVRVCNMCWFFIWYIYLFEQLFVIPPSALCIDVTLWGSQSWLLPPRSLLLYKIKSPHWLIHKATEQKGIIDSWRKECVCVSVCGCWDNWRQSSRFRTGSRIKKRAGFSPIKRKQVTKQLDKRTGSRGGRRMKWRVSTWMQIIFQQGHKAAAEELTWPRHLLVQ